MDLHHPSHTEEAQALQRKGPRGLAERFLVSSTTPSSCDLQVMGPLVWTKGAKALTFGNRKPSSGLCILSRRRKVHLLAHVRAENVVWFSPPLMATESQSLALLPGISLFTVAKSTSLRVEPGTSATLPLSTFCSSKMNSSLLLCLTADSQEH